MRRSAVSLFLALSTALAVSGCSSPAPPGRTGTAREPAAASPATVRADPATVKADELGLVPVLMYHQLTARPAGVYDRTPADFAAELERLAKEDYVPVTAGDFSTGDLDIPAGSHPVVLTFDDSTNSQVRLGANGVPAPDSAVGILLATERRHPGFHATATFFVNEEAFTGTGSAKALVWLDRHGFEIGNHTLRHGDLRTMDPAAVGKAISGEQRNINRAVPGTRVRSLALPYGSMPRPAELAVRGPGYHHLGVYLVGANPAPSPFAAAFDAGAIPRIRSAGAHDQDAAFGSTVWLDKLASSGGRYTSDGDPRTISFPRSRARDLKAAFAARARPY
ncbi:polysaccharide deacetylase family protein [Streptomyces sp. NPDC088725]|uniref:polysaccharide deacetylase family protein n=1 Tax=Streptomyces sp. NPDC088725 TaxID=3365873 RepID=UPI00381BFBE8